jgi:hypothetical protein
MVRKMWAYLGLILSYLPQYIFSVEFEALPDADGCKLKYCPRIVGPRIKQQ